MLPSASAQRVSLCAAPTSTSATPTFISSIGASTTSMPTLAAASSAAPALPGTPRSTPVTAPSVTPAAPANVATKPCSGNETICTYNGELEMCKACSHTTGFILVAARFFPLAAQLLPACSKNDDARKIFPGTSPVSRNQQFCYQASTYQKACLTAGACPRYGICIPSVLTALRPPPCTQLNTSVLPQVVPLQRFSAYAAGPAGVTPTTASPCEPGANASDAEGSNLTASTVACPPASCLAARCAGEPQQGCPNQFNAAQSG